MRDNGENIREKEIPAEYREEARAKREEMLEEVSMFSDELMEAVLEGGEIDAETDPRRHPQRHPGP